METIENFPKNAVEARAESIVLHLIFEAFSNNLERMNAAGG